MMGTRSAFFSPTSATLEFTLPDCRGLSLRGHGDDDANLALHLLRWHLGLQHWHQSHAAVEHAEKPSWLHGNFVGYNYDITCSKQLSMIYGFRFSCWFSGLGSVISMNSFSRAARAWGSFGMARWFETEPLKKDRRSCLNLAGWWFGTFFIFPYIGNNHPNWLIFFRGVQTTNQLVYDMYMCKLLFYLLGGYSRGKKRSNWNMMGAVFMGKRRFLRNSRDWYGTDSIGPMKLENPWKSTIHKNGYLKASGWEAWSCKCRKPPYTSGSMHRKSVVLSHLYDPVTYSVSPAIHWL